MTEILAREDSAKFIEALNVEMNALKALNLGTMCSLPKGKKTVDSKVFYKIKYHPITEEFPKKRILKYKARLVAKGFSQIPGQDYFDTYAPVAQLVGIRILMTLCVNLSLTFFQLDIGNAFINTDLKEEIYLKLPEGLKQYDPVSGIELVMRLLKTLYGLKQAPKEWYETIAQYLIEFGFNQSEVDPCMMVFKRDNVICYICLYVDDIPGGCNCPLLQAELLEFLQKRFVVTNSGVHQLLGMGMSRVGDVIELDNNRHIQDLLKKFDMLNCKVQRMALSTDFIIDNVDSPVTEENKSKMNGCPYQSLLGALLWISRCSRPDISLAICILSRFSNNPSMRHYEALKGVLSYLKGTQDYRLRFSKVENFDISQSLISFSDSDWAADRIDRKSTSGFCISLFGCPISWGCQKQKIVALSTTEAEYIAMSWLVKELIYVRNLLNSIHIKQKKPSVMYFDNTGAGFLSKNPTTGPLSKHIDVKYHHIRDCINKGLIEPIKVNTKGMLADIFTKAIAAARLKMISFIYMNMIGYSSSDLYA
jgi:hypothetical protein